jgi:hypothetical protein
MFVRKHFPEVIDDNTETYFTHLQGVVESIDINASIEVTKKLSGVNIRIAPSENKYFNLLRKDVENIHNLLKLRMNYSKSMKASGTINFNIDF